MASVATLEAKEGIPIQIVVPYGQYTKNDKDFTYTAKMATNMIFPVSPAVTNNVYRCKFKINKIKGNQCFGFMRNGLTIPFNSGPNVSPFQGDNAFFYEDGSAFWNGVPTTGNKRMKDKDVIEIEVNLKAQPRTAHLFINEKQQPIFISNIPEEVQFFFFVANKNDSVTVISLKTMNEPTITNISGAKELRWF
ncbi:MAG: hypothetical protein EZS28_044008 [Streblomastix strix]|uniref:Galectin n=1 Tax=Streblomastix strix TaxID=222440 RepID=A0A5J4TT03_9EUKA|nr:MAG: hypothetical protein EZS28_044008 [Streblomastix strix]